MWVPKLTESGRIDPTRSVPLLSSLLSIANGRHCRPSSSLVLTGEGDGGGNGRGKEERRKKKKRRKMRKRRDYKGRAEEDEVGKEGCARIGSLNLNANRYNSVVLTSLFREPVISLPE